MGVWRLVWLGVLFGVVSLVNLAPPAVSAQEAYAVSSQVRLTGEVPTWTILILDEGNNIKQVFCNGTAQGSVMAAQNNPDGAIVPVTPEVAAQYDRIKSGLDYHYGIIYEKPALQLTAKPVTPVAGLKLGNLQLKGDSRLLGSVDIQGSDVNQLVGGRAI
jgi:hypothetical protein